MINRNTNSFTISGFYLVLLIIQIFLLPEKIFAQSLNLNTNTDTLYLWNGKNLDGFELILKTKNFREPNSYFVNYEALHFYDTQIGYFLTEGYYDNYILHTEWRWPEKTEKANSGILIHVQPPDTVWPRCMQVQLKDENAGDLIAMVGATVYDGKEFSSGTVKKIAASSENPVGEWNTSDIICRGDSITVTINDVLQNTGSQMNLSSGKIGFQLEGKAIEFRNIFLIKL